MESDGKPFHHIHVEITNRCNLRCPFCATSRRALADMALADFAAILAQIAPLTGQINLHVLGEPLLHPDLPAMLELCQKAQLQANLTTNGTLLHKHEHWLLHAPGLRQINISLQALALLPDRDALLETILHFALRTVRERPEMYINLRLWTLRTLHDTDIDPWAAQVLARIAEVFDWGGALPCGRKSVRVDGRAYLHRDSLFSWPGDMDTPGQTRGFCHALSTHCAILVDGTVCPCCLDADGELHLGNIHDTSLREILDSPRANAIRAGFARGQLIEAQCQHCLYCRRFKKFSASSQK